MTTPHIRDLNLPDWHEVPQNATIPAGTRFARTSPGGEWFVVHGPTDYRAADRIPGARYFTAEPIPEPREAEIEAEAARLYRLAFPLRTWKYAMRSTREGFRTLAIDSLDRQAARE